MVTVKLGVTVQESEPKELVSTLGAEAKNESEVRKSAGIPVSKLELAIYRYTLVCHSVAPENV